MRFERMRNQFSQNQLKKKENDFKIDMINLKNNKEKKEEKVFFFFFIQFETVKILSVLFILD